MSDLAPAPTRRRGTRCPTCGARVTSEATWCSLCFTDLTPPAAAVASVEVAAPATEAADAPDAADALDAPDAAEADRIADQLIAELAAADPSPARRTPDLVSSTAGRTVAMVVGTVLMAALGFGLLALGGSLL